MIIRQIFVFSVFHFFVDSSLGVTKRDFLCRYSVNKPATNWLTAEKTCSQNGSELVNIADARVTSILLRLIEQIEKFDQGFKNYSRSAGFWVGAFYQRSPMLTNCKHLNYKPSRKPSSENSCFYMTYNGEFETSGCKDRKLFICELPLDRENQEKPCQTHDPEGNTFKYSKGVVNCMTSTQLDNINYTLLCVDLKTPTQCIDRSLCYTSYENISYHYKSSKCPSSDQIPNTTKPILRRRIYTYHRSLPSVPSDDLKVSERCPEKTKEDFEKEIKLMKQNLTIGRKETNKYKRTLISAPDHRISSRNIGIVGIVVLVLACLIIILADIPQLVQFLKQFRKPPELLVNNNKNSKQKKQE